MTEGSKVLAKIKTLPRLFYNFNSRIPFYIIMSQHDPFIQIFKQLVNLLQYIANTFKMSIDRKRFYNFLITIVQLQTCQILPAPPFLTQQSFFPHLLAKCSSN